MEKVWNTGDEDTFIFLLNTIKKNIISINYQVGLETFTNVNNSETEELQTRIIIFVFIEAEQKRDHIIDGCLCARKSEVHFRITEVRCRCQHPLPWWIHGCGFCFKKKLHFDCRSLEILLVSRIQTNVSASTMNGYHYHDLTVVLVYS